MKLPFASTVAAFALSLSLAARAAEPAPAPPASTTEPATTAAAPAAGTSAWLASFPADRQRPVTDFAGANALLLWRPVAPWRGDVLLLPGPANSGRATSLLLPLADRLAAAGWRCWLLPREQPDPIPADSNLATVFSVIRAEPPPASRAEGVNKPGLFLLAEADTASLALTSNRQQASAIAGTVLLVPTFPQQTDIEPPAQPVLEVDRQPTTPAQLQARKSRSQRWAQQAHYQFHPWVLPAQADASQWLARVIDGWLRKTSLATEQASGNSAQKKDMTAQTETAKP